MNTYSIPSFPAQGYNNMNKTGYQVPVPMMGNYGGQVISFTANSKDIIIPSDVVGAIIGKNGETIKQLQEKSNCRMQIVQDGVYAGTMKLLRLFGEKESINNAHRYAHEIMISKHSSPNGSIDVQAVIDKVTNLIENKKTDVIIGNTLEVPVPREVVGFVIGKHGETIKKISTDSGCQVQFSQTQEDLFEKICIINGDPDKIPVAKAMIMDIIDKKSGVATVGPPAGAPGIFSIEYGVPIDKAGLIIGKGGDTIKQISAASCCYLEVNNNIPPSNGLKYFTIRGSPDQINYAKQMINDKINTSNNLPNQPTVVTGQVSNPAIISTQQNFSNQIFAGYNDSPWSGSQNPVPRPNMQQPNQSNVNQSNVTPISPTQTWPMQPTNTGYISSSQTTNPPYSTPYMAYPSTYMATTTPQMSYMGTNGQVAYTVPLTMSNNQSQKTASTEYVTPRQNTSHLSSNNQSMAMPPNSDSQQYSATWASYYDMYKKQNGSMYQ